MTQPMMKAEDLRSRLARRSPDAPRLHPEEIARAEELERKLGRPLRLEIDGPLTDEESEEVILARLMDSDNWIPAEKFLEDFKHLLRKKTR